MDAARQNALVLPDAGPADAGVDLHPEVVSERPHDLLDLLGKLSGRRENQALAFHEPVVDLLQDPRAESRRLPRSGLRLLDHVQALAERHDPPLLYGRGLLEACDKAQPKTPLTLSLPPQRRNGRSTEELVSCCFTVGVDAPQEILLQPHGIEGLVDLVIRGEEVLPIFREPAWGSVPKASLNK